MSKKLRSVLFALVMLLSFVPALSIMADGTNGEGGTGELLETARIIVAAPKAGSSGDTRTFRSGVYHNAIQVGRGLQ